LKKQPIAACGMAVFRSASAQRMEGDFPPSSSVTRLKSGMLAARIARPVSVEPVKATLATPWCPASAAPVPPSPVSTVKTPAETHLPRQLGQPQRRERRFRRRFQDQRAAGGKRGRNLPHGQHQREIPRGDRRDHADGSRRV
jgi:hypothetical protein